MFCPALFTVFSLCFSLFNFYGTIFNITDFFLFYYVKSTDEPDKRHSSYLLFLIPRVSI